MLLDMNAPKFNTADAQGSLKALQPWLIALVDNINVCLSNLDEGNLVDGIFDNLTATKVVAETVISTTIITQNLYAEYGDIAELTVDRLITANKVAKYQAKDTSEINYVWIQDQSMKLITGTNTGTTIQHRDRSGNLLYWKDAAEIAMGTDPTSYPVMVYAYAELVKAEISFAMDIESGHYTPMITLGAGTGTGSNGKSYIYKGVTGLRLKYYTSGTGELREIALSDKGITLTPYELEKIDFYSNGFKVRYSGETYTYAWTKDGQGRITALTSANNLVIPINWYTGVM